MSIQSMTGFARETGQSDGCSWVWEIRSVNGKGLDIRFRLPQGYEDVEADARKILASRFGRGNIQVSLQVSDDNASAIPIINEHAVVELSKAAENLQKKIGGDLPGLADYLMVKGVVEYETPQLDEASRENRNTGLLSSFESAALQLAEARMTEGAAIGKLVLNQLDRIDKLRSAIEQNDARSEKVIQQRLRKQVKRLSEETDLTDENRLYQEAVILAAKADLQEELDRLKVHLDAAQKLMNGGGVAGRKLDFLAQEFNRECNTICSKSNAAEVTTLGLDMKIVIDQFREQIQNLE